MPSISIPAVIGGVGAVAGGAIQAGAAKDAAQLQYQASQQAAALQWQMFQQMQGNLAPYMQVGSNALNSLSMLTGTAGSNDAQIRQLQQQLTALTGGAAAATTGPGAPAPGGATATRGIPTTGGFINRVVGTIGNELTGGGTQPTAGPMNSPLTPEVQAQVKAIQDQIRELQGSNQPGNPLTAPLTAPFNPTMQQLEQTPGYQFTLNQGLRATQNAATAMGLGQSGSAIAGAGDYAAGLASQTYQQQYNNYWTQNQNIYNMLAGLATAGQNAAAGTGTAGIQTGGAIGNLLTGGASALGAGQVGAANAWAGGIGGAAGAGGNAALMLALSRNGLFGGTPSGAASGGADSSWVYGGAAGYQPAGSWSPEGYAY